MIEEEDGPNGWLEGFNNGEAKVNLRRKLGLRIYFCFCFKLAYAPCRYCKLRCSMTWLVHSVALWLHRMCPPMSFYFVHCSHFSKCYSRSVSSHMILSVSAWVSLFVVHWKKKQLTPVMKKLNTVPYLVSLRRRLHSYRFNAKHKANLRVKKGGMDGWQKQRSGREKWD